MSFIRTAFCLVTYRAFSPQVNSTFFFQYFFLSTLYFIGNYTHFSELSKANCSVIFQKMK